MIAAHRARLIPALAVLAALLLPLLPASAETSEKIHLPKAAALSADELRDAIGDAAQARDPVVLSLMSDLEMFKANQAERDEARRKAYEETMAKMAEDLKNGKLEDALIDAIEANGLADDPKAMLLNEKVLELVARCEDQAKAAEKEGNWIEALHLYRALNLLFENQYRYDKPVDRCEQRVRLLRYYAPKELKRLLGERAKKLGKPVDESDDIKLDSWKQTHKDVELSMYRQALRHVAANHISNTSYNELLLASIDAMQRFVETEPIKATFPVLGDASKVRAFKTALDDIRVAVVKKGDDLNFLDMHLLVDRIRRANDEIIELPEAVLTYELTNGATGILDDFSTVIWPSELETFSRSTQGKFYGVGIQISRRDGRLVVVTPLPNTPAFDAGVKAGDIIAEVNGENTDAWSLDRAVREITGPEGTEVNLGIERVGHKELIPLAVTRAEIVIESVKGWDHDEKGEWDFYIDREAKIGYIRLSQFIPQSVEHIDEAIKQMERDNGLEGLIIDLRFNPGGLLSSAIDITDRFISAGPIVSTQGRDGRTEHEVRATESATFRSFPVTVLINQGSASASEIVSGAVQDWHRGVIVGERTFGKGSVQDLYKLSGGRAYLKLTTQYYRLPKKRIIHRMPGAKSWGVEPDVEVRMTPQQIADSIEFRQKVDVLLSPEDIKDGDEPQPKAHAILEGGFDAQLETALVLVKSRIVAERLSVVKKAERDTETVPSP